jgi:hypothetical protein
MPVKILNVPTSVVSDSIQLFHFQGLTLIDSPSLNSSSTSPVERPTVT